MFFYNHTIFGILSYQTALMYIQRENLTLETLLNIMRFNTKLPLTLTSIVNMSFEFTIFWQCYQKLNILSFVKMDICYCRAVVLDRCADKWALSGFVLLGSPGI